MERLEYSCEPLFLPNSDEMVEFAAGICAERFEHYDHNQTHLYSDARNSLTSSNIVLNARKQNESKKHEQKHRKNTELMNFFYLI